MSTLNAVHVVSNFPVYLCFLPSSYPDNRVKQDDKGRDVGVVGNVSLLQNVALSSQPISSMDWNHDKVCGIMYR